MAYTATQLAALEAALASGVLNVRYSDGKSVTYQSVADLKTAIAEVKGGILAGSTTRVRQIRMYSDKGF